MAYTKGKEKTGGRRKGTQNKLTKEIRDLLKELYTKELENLDDLIAELSAKERLDFIIKLTPYVLPKVMSVTMSEGEPISFGNEF